jgi:hypothetical protein
MEILVLPSMIFMSSCVLMICAMELKKIENSCPQPILLVVALSMFSIHVAAPHRPVVTLLLLVAATLIVVLIVEVEVVDTVTEMMTMDIGIVMSAVVIAVIDTKMMVEVTATIAHMVVSVVLIAPLLHM